MDLGPLALVALAPLLWAWRGGGAARGAACGAVAGLVFFGLLVSWTRYFGVVAYVPFTLFLAGWWLLLGGAVGALARRGRASPVVVASLWVLVEAARGQVPFGGFSWGEVGYAFHDVAAARSVAAWGGVLFVSFLAVWCNALVVDAALAGWRSRRARSLLRPAAAGAGVVAVAVLAHLLLPEMRPTGRLDVALIQGNDTNRHFTAAELADRYLVRNQLRLAGTVAGPVDLVVFPESSLDADPRDDPALDASLAEVARRLDAAVLAGGDTAAPGGRLYNTTFHYTAEGRQPDLYHKRHLVPFGEYVPWRSALGFIRALEQIPTDYAPGRQGDVLFPVAGRPVGSLICYESAFRSMARGYARRGAEAIVVSTNNRSYRRSANSAQHLAMGRMRAAETGRPVLHAGISGRSGVIDASGRLLAETGLFEPTVLRASVTTTSGRTPYVAAGEWVLALAAGLVAAALRPARRRRDR